MKDFVLDASVSLGWLIDDPPSPYAARIQQLMINGAVLDSAGLNVVSA